MRPPTPRPSALPLLLVALSGCALSGCVAELDDPAAPSERVGEATQAISVLEAATTTCTTTSVKGLAEQIVDQSNCLAPGAFVKVPQIPNLSLGAPVFPYLEQPANDALVATLNDNAGTTMNCNSMLRTVAQQYLLHRWYQNGICNVHLAAVPGNSNHETGLAVDVTNYNNWKAAFQSHGFQWLGADDPVHFDYVGPGAVDYKGTDVLAFQQLWNRNHPQDLIDEDGIYGPQTKARLESSPADGFPIGADCFVAAPNPDVHPSVRMPFGEDFFEDGSSAGVIDLFEGEKYEVWLEIENKGGVVASAVQVAVWLEEPHLSAQDYLIESDWMHKGEFEETGANYAEENPVHGEPLPPAFTLAMHDLEPGETKRVTLVLRADAYSIGVTSAPDVRFWVQDVPDWYHQDDFDGDVTNVGGSQTFGARLQALLQTDVYSHTHWEWDTDRVEGWTPADGATITPDAGAEVLRFDGDGADPGLLGPETAFPAGMLDAVSIRARRAGGDGEAKLYFATEDAPELGEDNVVPFELPDDGAFHDLTLSMSGHPGWVGTITRLRVDPFATGPGTAELDHVRAISTRPGPDPGAGDGDSLGDPGCTCSAPGGARPRPALLWALCGALGAAAARRRRAGDRAGRHRGARPC